MSWISPMFGGDDTPREPPQKKSKPVHTTTPVEDLTIQQHVPSTSKDWLDTHKPITIGDLVVNNKKITEVEYWLKESSKLNSRNKFLLLTGPSGCGKTSLVQVLCKSLGYKILEWITPLDRPSDDYEFPSKFDSAKSTVKTFEEYIFRSSRYNSCLIVKPPKRIILVKDFPNAFLHNPNTFNDIMMNLRGKCVTPVVFICGDEKLSRKLFPPALKADCEIETITLCPVTDQRMVKLLKSILFKESRKNSKIKMLPDNSLSVISAACQGDIRSAISKLYFCSVNSNVDMGLLKLTPKHKKTKSKLENIPVDKDKRLDFFHGIGRVLYPKKTESGKDIRFTHSPDEVLDNFLCEPKGFINQLHENYPNKLNNVDDLNEAAERMATSDLLMSRWQERDIFQYYSLSVAVQGLMIANKSLKSKYEPFRRSQTSRMEIDSKALELEGKMLFSELQILDYERLLDILPYSRQLLPNLNQGQLGYVKKTIQFNS